MARGRASEAPAPDTPQGQLEKAASDRYDPIQRFFEEVAQRSGREPSTEKSAFYRYTRRGGALSGWRVALYADLLDLDPASIAPPDEVIVRRTEVRALREEVGELRAAIDRVERLLRAAFPAGQGSAA